MSALSFNPDQSRIVGGKFFSPLNWMGSKRAYCYDLQQFTAGLPEGVRVVEPFAGGGVLGSVFSNDWVGGDVNPWVVGFLNAMRDEGFVWVCKDVEGEVNLVLQSEGKAGLKRLVVECNALGWGSLRGLGLFLRLNRFAMVTDFTKDFRVKTRTPASDFINDTKRLYSVFPVPDLLTFSKNIRRIDYHLQGFDEFIPTQASEGCFLLCDPPYDATTGYHKAFDFQLFREVIQNVEGNCFVGVFNTDTPLIRELFDGWVFTPVTDKTTKGGRMRHGEVFISNFPVDTGFLF